MAQDADYSTHQDAVKGRRRSSSLDVTEDCHASVKSQAFDDKLAGGEFKK